MSFFHSDNLVMVPRKKFPFHISERLRDKPHFFYSWWTRPAEDLQGNVFVCLFVGCWIRWITSHPCRCLPLGNKEFRWKSFPGHNTKSWMWLCQGLITKPIVLWPQLLDYRNCLAQGTNPTSETPGSCLVLSSSSSGPEQAVCSLLAAHCCSFSSSLLASLLLISGHTRRWAGET